ncbi:MAG TPA: hypothetical protein VGK02_04130 [Candidatus Aquicultor sp.]|jgi:uncharacterized protein (DUF2147 family)
MRLLKYAGALATLAVMLFATLLFISAPREGKAAGDKKMFTISKPGIGTLQIEGRKDTAVPDDPNPLIYDPNPREWAGDDDQISVIENAIREALQTERDAVKYANKNKAMEFKQNVLAKHFSAKTKELKKRQDYIDTNNSMSDNSGIVVADSKITKVEFKGVSVNGNKATAVVDVWTQTRYENSKNAMIAEPANARQHTIELEQENGNWLIVSDNWVFIPGYEP